jgi:hypothetical protein
MLKIFREVLAGVLVLAALMAAVPLGRVLLGTAVQAQDWRTASRAPVGWAPDPDTYEPAVVQVYAAAAVRWRGAFSDHTWIAVKPAGAAYYSRYEVTGFYLRRNQNAIRVTETKEPDQRWFGARPKLLQDLRGAEAEAVISALPAALNSYPYANTYVIWPGPNSNTFIAYIGRSIPALHLTMPGNTIGKDFTGWQFIAPTPSNTGLQLSLGGALGIMLAKDEGIEINILGLVIGANPLNLSLTLPSIGRFPGREDWTNGAHQAKAAAAESLAADTHGAP